MKTRMIHKRTRWLLTALLLSALSSWTASAALMKVDQTIWGMDCAPCAYSMEKALQKLDGVKHVTVSLNKGDAVLKFAPDNDVTLAEIQQTVRDSGFTPKGATLKVSGTLKHEGGELRLDVGKASYVLKPSAKAKGAWQRLQKTAQGATITITGRTMAGHAGQIMVLEANRVARQVSSRSQSAFLFRPDFTGRFITLEHVATKGVQNCILLRRHSRQGAGHNASAEKGELKYGYETQSRSLQRGLSRV